MSGNGTSFEAVNVAAIPENIMTTMSNRVDLHLLNIRKVSYVAGYSIVASFTDFLYCPGLIFFIFLKT